MSSLYSNGMLPLAYTLAKSNGLNELAEQILQEANISEKMLNYPNWVMLSPYLNQLVNLLVIGH